jgi:rod shape-determining protein MreC
MIRLSIQARQALARLTLPVLIVVSFGVMLLGKADSLLAERARIALTDGLGPIYAVLAAPLGRIHATIAETAALWDMREENARLRDENEKLRRWQSIALALDAENQRLKASLHWIPDPTASFVTARVVADAGGVYAKAVLLSVGPNHGIRKGEIALDERGLIGRITEVGSRTARILLITDLNSRIPVIMETSRAHAILVGTNGLRPRLLYWPEGIVPQDGERIVTSAEANAFPANLPIGTVHYSSNGAPEVEPAAMLQKLEVVRIFDYGLNGVTAPEPSRQAVDRPTPGRH